MEKIILKNIGRGKFSGTVEVPPNPSGAATSLWYLELVARQEAAKHLASHDVDIAEIDGKPGHYGVYAGFHKVGEVEIIRT